MEKTLQDKLQPLLVDATTVTTHAEELRAHAKDHASVLPKDFMHDLGALVNELRDLRDAIHNVGLDPNDDLALPRHQRPRDERPFSQAYRPANQTRGQVADKPKPRS